MVHFLKLYAFDDIETKNEICYYIQSKIHQNNIDQNAWMVLFELIGQNETYKVTPSSALESEHIKTDIIEFGPNLSIKTAWSVNAHNIIEKSCVYCFTRIERSFRTVDKEFFKQKFDKMTQTIYKNPLKSFDPVENQIEAYNQDILYEHPITIKPSNIRDYNKIYQLGLSEKDMYYYFQLFKKHLNKNPNTAELVMLATLNNEHSRHRFFRGEYDIYNFHISPMEEEKLKNPKYNRTVCAQYIHEKATKSLFKDIQIPHVLNKNNSMIAFSDNASAIKGFETMQLNQYWNAMIENQNITFDSDDEDDNTNDTIYLSNRKISLVKRLYHPTLKAETHNFPTGIAPFEGAATGVGGRIRDNIAIGRGGFMVAGMAGYSVGNLYSSEKIKLPSDIDNSPLTILINASDGASDYGNKIGEPIILGFTRSFGDVLNYREIISKTSPNSSGYQSFSVKNIKERKEWLKPIMFSAGIGFMDDNHIEKQCEPGYAIMQIGGPAYRIGINGGSASSKEQDIKDKDMNFAAVQRGDPEMESKVVKFVNICLHMGITNPILSIHDQGAGGMANVLSEICQPHGAIVYMQDTNKGDDSMSDMEVLLSEFQEQVSILVHAHDISLINVLANREGLNIAHVGNIVDTDSLTVLSVVNVDETNDERYKEMYTTDDDDDDETATEKFIKLIDLPVNHIFDSLPVNKYKLIEPYVKWEQRAWSSMINSDKFLDITLKILRNINVGSKRFLTSKVDRSVGQVSQQQTVGITQTPLSDYASITNNYFGVDNITNDGIDFPGVITAIGEQPIKGIYDVDKMVKLTIAEMLTNMIWAGIEDFTMIRCAANWMWSNNNDTDKYLLRKALLTLKESLIELGIAVDGGKDSLSMSVKTKNETIKSPNTLTLTGYVTSLNIRQKVNAGFIKEDNHIIYINLSNKYNRLGGSIMSQVCDKMSDTDADNVPNFESMSKFPLLFDYIQYHIKHGNIIAGHDVSDGGLITTILEMCFPNNKGCNIDFKGLNCHDDYETFMAEEPGLLMELKADINYQHFIDCVNGIGYHQIYKIGHVTEKDITISRKGNVLINEPTVAIRKAWEEPSHNIENIQIGPELAKMELNELLKYPKDKLYNLPINIEHRLIYLEKEENIISNLLTRKRKTHFDIKIAIIREEGSNGDREMKAAFTLAGFIPYDIHMNDILSGKIHLNNFMGIAFVGGFSYADTFGAANGWASCIKNNPSVKAEFDAFHNRTDTFSLGICNGCQLMSLLNWVPFESKFVQNDSKRFESRYSVAKVTKNHSIMLNTLEGLRFGIWSAHGEGKYQSTEVNDLIKDNNFDDNTYYNTSFPIRYVDYDGNPTETYPHNPNGSPQGIGAVISDDGRHLAMMPHPERSFMMWQLAHCPSGITKKLTDISPWFLMFKNAYLWCQTKIDEKIAKQSQEDINIDHTENNFM
jgi:phosphoribosylformylglycinamidine synthase